MPTGLPLSIPRRMAKRSVSILVLERYLRIYYDYQQTERANLLPLAEFSYNNSKHSATTLFPFFANYGFHPSMSLLPTDPDSKTPAAGSYVN